MTRPTPYSRWEPPRLREDHRRQPCQASRSLRVPRTLAPWELPEPVRTKGLWTQALQNSQGGRLTREAFLRAQQAIWVQGGHPPNPDLPGLKEPWVAFLLRTRTS